MTPPHIEKAALGLLVRSGHKKRSAQMERSTNSTDWQDAVADATLVWSLARAHTIEEAAKVAKDYSKECVEKLEKEENPSMSVTDLLLGGSFGADEVAVRLLALAVEG